MKLVPARSAEVRTANEILGLYLGNAADFPMKGAEYTEIGGCLALFAKTNARENLLLPLSDELFPSQLHIFIFVRDVAPAVVDQAHRITASIRVLEPRTCFTEHKPSKR